MDQKTAQPVVVSDEKPRHRRRPIKLSVKSGLIIFLVGVLIILIGWRLYESHANNTIVIGGTRITQLEIKAYAAEVQRYSTAQHENFGGTPTQVADNDLILNAALKDQANKHHVTLTQRETDAALQYKYNAYGSKQAYQAALRNLGIVNIMKIRDQNIAYESILQNILIARKQVFMVGIYYDSPYFGKSKNPAALRTQATKIMQTKFLPLFKQHLSRRAIDKQTTVGTLTPNTSSTPAQTQLFFTGMPTTDMYIPNYSAANPTFNESGNNPIPGVKSANQAIDSLTKVGQYTQVETFKPDFIGILRLEGQTKGAYSSWNQLLQQYKSKYASKLALSQLTDKAFAQLLFTKLTEPFATLLHAGKLLIFPKVSATNFNDNSGCVIPPTDGTYQDHFATFWIRSFDVTTGASIEVSASQIGGAQITETRAQASCVNSNDLLIENGDPNTGTTASGSNLVFDDNCWNVAPAWSQAPPSNSNGAYTWQPGSDYSSNITLDTNSSDSNYGWPNWADGNINKVGNIDLELAYKPPAIPTQWTLSGSTRESVSSVEPGQSVTFYHYVQNLGPATASNYQWDVQTSSSASGPFTDTTLSGTSSANAQGYNPNGLTSTQTPWPNNTSTPSGAQYCQRIKYWNSSLDHSYVAGPAACVTLNNATAPVMTCNSLYEPGPPATATPTGNAPSGSTWSTDAPLAGYVDVQVSGTDAGSPADYQRGTEYTTLTVASGNPTGAVALNSQTLNYNPTGSTVTVTVTDYEYALQHDLDSKGNRVWVLYATSSTTTNLTCHTATCSLSVSGGMGPNGVIIAGQQVSITGTITNPSDPSHPEKVTLPANLPNNDPLSLTMGTEHDVGYPIDVGATSGPIDLGTVTANSGPNATPTTQTISAYADYYGTGEIDSGSGCSVTFSVYVPFTLTPNGSTTLAPDPEDPSSVDNDTYVTETGAPVSENVTSSIYEVNAGGTTIPKGNVSNGGPFNPSTTTCLYQSPSPYNVAGCDPTLSNGEYAPSIPLFAADTYCSVINVPVASGGYVGPSGDIVGGLPGSQTSCPEVVNKPFFKVYGSGAEAGGSFPSQPAPPGGGILASWDNWNNNNGLYPSYDYGGGSELANIANGNIVGYAGAQQSSQDLRPAPDLDFANTVSSTLSNGTYTPGTGGQYGNLTGSLPSEGCDQTMTTPTVWPGSMPSSAPGNYSFTASGDTSLGAITIYPGQNVCLSVTGSSALNPGNVYIGGDITYKNADSGGVWTPSTVPSFVLNVNGGNIYIAPGVGELDGTYAAEPNGGGGTIYTCGNSDYTAMSNSLLFTGCNQQLSVYGAFEAQSVNLMRTYGTLRDETPVTTNSTEVSGYDQPVQLAQYSCGTGNASNFYQQGHWYEAVNSDGSLAAGATGPPSASCPTPSLQAYDGYIFPPGDTTFTSNYLNGNYTLLCEYQLTISGADDHYVYPLAYNAASDCTSNAPDTTNPFPNNEGTVLGYIANSSWGTTTDPLTEPLYENFDGAYCGYGSSGFHSVSITNNGEPDNGGSTCGSPATIFGYVFTTPPTKSANSIDSFAETTNVPILGPPAGIGTHCSNNGGRTSPRPTCAAEVFDYSPEASLGFPVTTGASTSANSAVGIYNLPPVL